MAIIFSPDQVREYLTRGWSLSKKRIKGHYYGYLQRNGKSPIYLGKWTPEHSNLKRVLIEDIIELSNRENLIIKSTERLPIAPPSEPIRMKPSPPPARQSSPLLEKITTTAGPNLSGRNCMTRNHVSPFSEGSLNPSVPSPSPIKDEVREPLPVSLPMASLSLNDEQILPWNQNTPSAPGVTLTENFDPTPLALLLAAPVAAGGIGFAIRNWDALNKAVIELLKNIDQWEKNLRKDIDQWGKDRLKDLTTWWNGLFPH